MYVWFSHPLYFLLSKYVLTKTSQSMYRKKIIAVPSLRRIKSFSLDSSCDRLKGQRWPAVKATAATHYQNIPTTSQSRRSWRQPTDRQTLTPKTMPMSAQTSKLFANCLSINHLPWFVQDSSKKWKGMVPQQLNRNTADAEWRAGGGSV